MASPALSSPLDASGGREVVFCHACEHEWYRDERESLTCPSCGSDFIQIADSPSELREMRGIRTPSDLSGGLGSYLRRPGGASDSDPDEDDITEHLRGDPRFDFGRPDPRSGSPGDHDRANMNEGDAVLRRFADMLVNDLGAARAARGGNYGAAGLFPPDEHAHPSGPRFQRRTFETGPFGGTHTRVTITSGTIGGGPEGPAPNFGTLFGQLFGNPLLAGDDLGRRSGPRAPGGPEPGYAFMGGLQDLLASLYNPAAAVHGDAVFTQEALDRIVTQLMEASPQTNAAPPASQTAIDSLEKKKVDDAMLGPEGKAECTICIDEIHRGDEVVVLPCKHWYHGECVVLWLKEHNTCPICRMPIESRGNNSATSNSPNPSNDNNTRDQHQQQPFQPHFHPSSPTPPSPPTDPFAFANPFTTASSRATAAAARDRQRDYPQQQRPGVRSARENLDRLNSIRSLAAAGGGSGRSTPSGSRRNSHSPPAPGAWPGEGEGEAERAARVRDGGRERERERGGFEFAGGGRRGGGGEREEEGGSGSGSGSGGPLRWLREHFGR